VWVEKVMATEDFPRDRERPGRARSSFWPGHGTNRARTAVIGLILVGYAWAAGAAAPFSATALICVLIPGVVLAGLASWRPPERIPPPDKLDITGMSYWVICVAALFEWEASAYRDNSLPWHPSLTDLVNPMIGPHLFKSAAILIWILAGWALVRR
jgi:type IV secretory pathway VirB2 component (pilin)